MVKWIIMNVFLVILFLVTIYNIKPCLMSGNKDYLSVDDTNAVKGIFIMFVFFRHITSYLDEFEDLDRAMLKLDHALGQLIVVMFLFYSGYGVVYSILNRENYMEGFVKKRLGHLVLEFDVIVLIFYVVEMLVGRVLPIKRLALSLVAWDSVGNSNWYIFAIFFLYLFTFISWKLFKNNNAIFLLMMVILVSGYVLIMMQFKQDCWYNTVFAYVFGMFWAMYKERIDKVLGNNAVYIVLFIAAVAICFVTRMHLVNVVIYEVMSLAFAFLVVLFTMKVKVGNSILAYLGENLFPFYILQRLPMFVLKAKTDVTHNNTVFLMYSMIGTIVLVWVYRRTKKMIAAAAASLNKKGS